MGVAAKEGPCDRPSLERSVLDSCGSPLKFLG